MGALFHDYKTLLKLNSESKLSEDSIMQKVVTLEREKPLAKTLFDKTCERWRGLLYALHKDDREQLLRMVSDCCNSLDIGAAKTIMDKGSKGSVSILFFLCLVLQNQKLIERIKNSVKNENIEAISTIFDFVD